MFYELHGIAMFMRGARQDTDMHARAPCLLLPQGIDGIGPVEFEVPFLPQAGGHDLFKGTFCLGQL